MIIKKRFIKIFLLTLLINFYNDSYAITTNKIIVSVENQIVSSYELKNKIKTILFLSNQNFNQKNIDLFKQQALQQLIDYKLKKSEVLKFNIQVDNNEQINNYLKNKKRNN